MSTKINFVGALDKRLGVCYTLDSQVRATPYLNKQIASLPGSQPGKSNLVISRSKMSELTIEQQLEGLKARMIEAAAAGNLDAIMALGEEAKTLKKQSAKAENEKLLARTKELEGARQAFTEKLGRVVKSAIAKSFPELNGDILALDGKGCHVTYIIEGNSWNVGGDYPTVKVKGTGHKGGGGSKAQASYKLQDGSVVSLKLEEIAERFATKEEQAAIDAAESNSKSWQLKTAVKKAAIAAELLTPVS